MQVRAPLRRRVPAVATLVVGLLVVGALRAGAATDAPAVDAADAASAAALQRAVADGRHPWLRWPDFSDSREALRRFYEAEGWRPAWLTEDGATPQARELVAVLSRADAVGLRPSDYDAFLLAERLDTLEHAGGVDHAALELALSIGAMRHVSDLRVGRVRPEKGGFQNDVSERKLDLAAFLSELVRASPPEAIATRIAAVEPRYRRYRLLKQALARYRTLAADASLSQPLAVVRKLEPGDAYRDAPALARKLIALGDLAADARPPADPHLYDATLVQAVERFQTRHALAVDGILGAASFAALNVPLATRVEQIELALERWRWLPEIGPQLVGVNVPEFALYAVRREQPGVSGEDLLRMKVIVGRAFRTETPNFVGRMNEVVFRPYWNVPLSIARGEVVPKQRRDPGYFGRQGFEIVDGSGTRQPANASTLSAVAAGTLRVRQRPGPKNSLGLVKFLFPNRYSVYLHGTPAVSLFARARRDFSHGCIRVEDPVALAQWVLRDDPAWTRERIVEAMNGDASISVRLATPIPVFVVYATVVADDDGTTRFFADLYGQDAKLSKLLAAGYPYPW